MANNLQSNITDKVARKFAEAFEKKRVLSKNVSTRFFEGHYAPDTGGRGRGKRPHDYRAISTDTGDISGLDKNRIIAGTFEINTDKFITVPIEYLNIEKALELDQWDEIIDPAAETVTRELELRFAKFAMENLALLSGNPGSPIQSWDDIANISAVMTETGIPMSHPWCVFINSFTLNKLASDQRSLGGETGAMTANKQATVTENFAGMKVLTASSLRSYSTSVGADRVGTIAAKPLATYESVKDSLKQQIAVTGLGAGIVVKAGEQIQVTAATGSVDKLHLGLREPYLDSTGNRVKWTGTVTANVTLDGSGAGTLIVAGPAIYEVNGQYNTVTQAIEAGDVVTLLAPENKLIQPNLFWHKEALEIQFVRLPKLDSTDTIMKSKDGISMRFSLYADQEKNLHRLRIDCLPAFCIVNPYFGGHAFGI